MSRISRLIRTIILLILVFVMLFLCILRLMKLQIVDGAKYLAMTETSYTASQELIATRGQIFDINHKVLTTNKTIYRVILQKSFITAGTENEIINETVKILEKNDNKKFQKNKKYVII